jgi:protein gp37
MELFGDWVGDNAIEHIFDHLRDYPQHTFIFLTKQPQNLAKWSPFPDNFWVGVSVTNQESFSENLYSISKIKARVKFISFEPLLQGVNGTPLSNLKLAGINWVIIGQCTPVKMSTMPKLGWVEEIVTAADKAGVPVFLKDNLISCVDQYPFAFSGIFPDIKLRQEFPNKEGRC